MDRRDVNPDYLLGPFDAQRMIRLEGIPRGIATRVTAGFVQIQRLFPSFDRNITYVTWGTRVRGPIDPNFDRAAVAGRAATNSGWARRVDSNPGHRVPRLTVPGYIVLEAEHFGSRQAVNHSLDLFKTPKPPAPNQERRKSLSELLRSLPPHEHAHTLFNELTLIDDILAKHYVDELVDVVASVVDNYDARSHRLEVWDIPEKELGTTTADLPLLNRLREQGIHPQGLSSFEELTADALALHVLGRRSPLIDAVGSFYRRHRAHDSPTRRAEQNDLHDALSDIVDRSAPFGPRTLSRDWDAIAFGIEPDPRYASFLSQAPRLSDFSLGPSRVAELVDQREQLNVSQRAFEIATDVKLALHTTIAQPTPATGRTHATMNFGIA